MKTLSRFLISLFILVPFGIVLSSESKAEISCGQTITENTVLTEDLACDPDTDYAIVIGASNITLDLGGHTISGYTPKTGVFTTNQEGITIRNGIIDGFNVGVYIDQANRVTIENLTVKNLDIIDPNHFLFGIAVVGSQNVVVRDSLFEFPIVAHKEAIDIFDSYVDVSNIEVRGGGAGVNFSYRNDVCDPMNKPSNGTVRNSRFVDVYLGGVLVSCSSYAWIEGNYISGGLAGGINGSGPFPEAVTGLVVKGNVVRGDHYVGIELGGSSGSTVLKNIIFENYYGISIAPSLGCLNPDTGWECFYSTANVIVDNQTFGNSIDLYHHVSSLGSTWERNTCKTKEGAEIPECTPPKEVLVINYSSGKPGSFFTLEGANFPADSSVTIVVNGYTLGTVLTDAIGNIIFLINTEQADLGWYMVSTSEHPSASASFVLDSNKQIRSQEGSGTVFNLPGGLITYYYAYLPLVHR